MCSFVFNQQRLIRIKSPDREGLSLLASHSAPEALGISFVLDAPAAALTAEKATITRLIDHSRAPVITLLPFHNLKNFSFRLRFVTTVLLRATKTGAYLGSDS